MNRPKPEETQCHPFQRHPVRVTLSHQLLTVNLHQEDIVDETADPSNRDPAVRTIPPNDLQNEIHFFRQENLSVNWPMMALGPVFLNIVNNPSSHSDNIVYRERKLTQPSKLSHMLRWYLRSLPHRLID